jgi:acetyl-CoA carboxylase biotin carboxylase subunit
VGGLQTLKHPPREALSMSTRSIRKLLIANRGEIAVRVMSTCRIMGISTVAVYSDADLRSPHVRHADQAINIGPAPAAESYLQIARIINAAERTGADAIHPGYGFLSENPELASACEDAGIIFVGPSADSIRRMGSKSVARKLMADAGVPIVPGYDGEDQSTENLISQSLAIGLPVLIKASAGGGGKGMRVVHRADTLEDSIGSARREAEKAFGDGSLLLEKYVERARHIEVQVLGDSHGNLIHLFERECSIQRRHQKVIEESPSPAITPELRTHICDAAVTAARAIGYTNAGTIEFILSPSGEFYFIEMNTRLQVEHPVTEMITWLDLVQLQIAIAEGQTLPLSQRDVRRFGHAIEARLYAEDPVGGFLPASGKIRRWQLPEHISGLRIDSSIEEGADVGIYYDPLLAKMIARGSDRGAAVRKLAYALRDTVAHGVKTNRELLLRILEHPKFETSTYHTEFISEHESSLLDPQGGLDYRIAAVVVALYLHEQRKNTRLLPASILDYRNNPFRDPSVRLEVDEKTIEVSWRQENDTVALSGEDWRVIALPVSFEPGSIRAAIDGIQQVFRVTADGDRFYVQSESGYRLVTRLPRYPETRAGADQEDASAPMPGLVSRILVEPGQDVKAGDPLMILEAMKMEQTLRAATDGVVESIKVKLGDVVAPGDLLVHIRKDAGS